MFHCVEMDVLHVAGEIGVVPDGVVPEPLLPDAANALGGRYAAFGVSVGPGSSNAGSMTRRTRVHGWADGWPRPSNVDRLTSTPNLHGDRFAESESGMRSSERMPLSARKLVPKARPTSKAEK